MASRFSAYTGKILDVDLTNETVGQYPLPDGGLYFTVSIGEPYEGYCYKLVAGIINPL